MKQRKALEVPGENSIIFTADRQDLESPLKKITTKIVSS